MKTNLSPVKTEYKCPICNAPLYRQWGSQMFVGDKNHGVTLFCIKGDPNGRNHPQEVSGHGNCRANASDDVMIANAYAVVMARFAGGKMPQAETEEIEVELPTVTAVVEIEKPTKKSKGTRVKGLRVVAAEPDPEEALL